MGSVIKITLIAALIIFGTIALYPYAIVRYVVLGCVFVILFIKKDVVYKTLKDMLTTIRKKNAD